MLVIQKDDLASSFCNTFLYMLVIRIDGVGHEAKGFKLAYGKKSILSSRGRKKLEKINVMNQSD